MKKGDLQQNKSTNVRMIEIIILLYGLALNSVAALSPSLGTRLATRVFLSTHRSRQRKEEKKLEDRAEQTQIGHGKGKVVFYSWGQGPSVLLVHGWNSRATQLGYLVPPLLKRGFRVISFDAPGHGRSEGKHATLFDFAEAIRLAEQWAGPFHGIITHSMGGAAGTLAVASGLKTRRLVYIAPPYHPMAWLDRFAERLRLSSKLLRRLKDSFEVKYGKRWRILHDPSLLASMSTDLLVIHDQKDSQVPWQEGSTLARAWPSSQFHLTQGLGHNRILRDPEVIRRAVEFIQVPEDFLTTHLIKGEKYENHSQPYLEKIPQPLIPGLPLGNPYLS